MHLNRRIVLIHRFNCCVNVENACAGVYLSAWVPVTEEMECRSWQWMITRCKYTTVVSIDVNRGTIISIYFLVCAVFRTASAPAGDKRTELFLSFNMHASTAPVSLVWLWLRESISINRRWILGEKVLYAYKQSQFTSCTWFSSGNILCLLWFGLAFNYTIFLTILNLYLTFDWIYTKHLINWRLNCNGIYTTRIKVITWNQIKPQLDILHYFTIICQSCCHHNRKSSFEYNKSQQQTEGSKIGMNRSNPTHWN